MTRGHVFAAGAKFGAHRKAKSLKVGAGHTAARGASPGARPAGGGSNTAAVSRLTSQLARRSRARLPQDTHCYAMRREPRSAHAADGGLSRPKTRPSAYGRSASGVVRE